MICVCQKNATNSTANGLWAEGTQDSPGFVHGNFKSSVNTVKYVEAFTRKWDSQTWTSLIFENWPWLSMIRSSNLPTFLNIHKQNWLVVLTILKNISQWAGSHILWKIKNVWNHQREKDGPTIWPMETEEPTSQPSRPSRWSIVIPTGDPVKSWRLAQRSCDILKLMGMSENEVYPQL
jgi:hypothetical protein